ncbi:MAG: response regulator [Lachnospiraceae bacterium]|nr:response regulator [Lachnospiraceae bacterium]
MNRKTYEEERIRGVHLSILIVLTVAVIGVSLSGIIIGRDEVWLLPFLIAGALICWGLHIRQMLSPRSRLLIYAGILFSAIILDGVQPSSIFNIAVFVAIAMTMFSQADSRMLLHLCLLVYLFLAARQVLLLMTGRGIPVTGVVITEILIHTLIVLLIHRIAVYIVHRRMTEAAADAQEIEALKEMQKRTEDFLTNVSHELRTPINAVTGIGDMMMREAKEESRALRASQILSAGKRLSGQVEDMLDYSEIVTGKLVIAEETYAVSSLVNDVATACAFFEKEEAERIRIEVAEGIPDCLLGGARWIKKLLMHLIENALLLSEEGDIAVSVYAKTRDYGINLCLEVCHVGRRISRKERERILGGSVLQEEQEHRRVSTFELGLRIIYGLAHAMGGFVHISSEAEGACLRVTVPQRIARGSAPSTSVGTVPSTGAGAGASTGAESGAATAQTQIRVRHRDVSREAEERPADAPVLSGRKALVVDDEPMNLIVAEGILSGYGLVIETAESGKQAIEKVRNTRYDIIFMDHMMPEMDGVEAAHHIRVMLAGKEEDTKIVALTANAVSGAREMFLREGFDGFVAKPIVRAELERTLRSISAESDAGGRPE